MLVVSGMGHLWSTTANSWCIKQGEATQGQDRFCYTFPFGPRFDGHCNHRPPARQYGAALGAALGAVLRSAVLGARYWDCEKSKGPCRLDP